MALAQLDVHMEKDELMYLPHTTHKNELEINHRLKCKS